VLVLVCTLPCATDADFGPIRDDNFQAYIFNQAMKNDLNIDHSFVKQHYNTDDPKKLLEKIEADQKEKKSWPFAGTTGEVQKDSVVYHGTLHASLDRVMLGERSIWFSPQSSASISAAIEHMLYEAEKVIQKQLQQTVGKTQTKEKVRLHLHNMFVYKYQLTRNINVFYRPLGAKVDFKFLNEIGGDKKIFAGNDNPTEPRVLMGNGSPTAEEMKSFCNAAEKEKKYGWRSLFDQDELMLCPWEVNNNDPPIKLVAKYKCYPTRLMLLVKDNVPDENKRKRLLNLAQIASAANWQWMDEDTPETQADAASFHSSFAGNVGIDVLLKATVELERKVVHVCEVVDISKENGGLPKTESFDNMPAKMSQSVSSISVASNTGSGKNLSPPPSPR